MFRLSAPLSCMCMIAFHIIRIACKSNVCHASMGMYVSPFHVNLVMCSGCVCVLGCGPAHCPVLVAGHRQRAGRLVGAFVGWALGRGLGGFAMPHFGRANAFPSTGVASETRGNSSKRWPSAKTGGGPDPSGAQNQTPPSDFAVGFCYSKTI